MTGVPPFCDETVEKIFENILSYNLEWPEGEEALSAEAVSCIKSLLCEDPVNRSNLERLYQHPLFKVSDIMVALASMLNEVPINQLNKHQQIFCISFSVPKCLECIRKLMVRVRFSGGFCLHQPSTAERLNLSIQKRSLHFIKCTQLSLKNFYIS